MSLRYELRIMGVSIDEATNALCDNKSVVNWVCTPESNLNNKYVFIAHHKCRESFATSITNIYIQFSEDNLANLWTKVLSVEEETYFWAYLCINYMV